MFVLPLLIYSSVRSVFNLDEANKDCASFPDEGYDFEKGACEARFWTFLAGGGTILAILGAMTFFGLIEAIPNILKVKNKALARIRPSRASHPLFNLAVPSMSAPYGNNGLENRPLIRNGEQGYRSADEVRNRSLEPTCPCEGLVCRRLRRFGEQGFFNFKTSVTDQTAQDTDQMLYAPRVTFSLPVAGQPVQYVQTARGTAVHERL